MAEMTPMMKQYFEIKKDYPDAILLFRLGDFYEMFFEDAKIASKVLELVLTGRDCGQPERAPMCGMPFHSADTYIARLVNRGYKVAICDQLEDPALAKGIVKRDVTRVITPGTVIEGNMLEESKNNYLCCIYNVDDKVGICFADVSTGDVHLTTLFGRPVDEKIVDELGRFSPVEVLMNEEVLKMAKVKAYFDRASNIFKGQIDDSDFDYNSCERIVRNHFKVNSSENLGIDSQIAVSALGVTIEYLRGLRKNELDNIKEVDYYSQSRYMKLDINTRRNLELNETMRTRDKKGSLLWTLDKTKTAMGKRLIRSWIERPLVNSLQIIRRQNAVDELYSNSILRQDETALLSEIYDLERIMTRISYGSANARELKSLADTAEKLIPLKENLKDCLSNLLQSIFDDIDTLDDIHDLIVNAIEDDPPFSVREGGMIRAGYSQELDSFRDIVQNGKGYLAKIEAEEQEKTGIKKLKIGYNKVFGYYIEVSNSFKEQVPEEYIRKQTLANCERFITQELKDLESKILTAQDRIVSLEYEIFESIRKRVADELFRVQRTGHAVAQLDVLCSFAQVATSNNYVRPEIDESSEIEIVDGRHPVVELMLDGAPFVPNNTVLDDNENRCAIITGPNMAGKSTYMRQVAIITLMAQIGCFVPAKRAKVGIVDSIFTRVGASDDLTAGQSTFMVEMSEVALILANATKKSLIIFDEIGRGTATYDGMSIAKAVLEFAVDKKRLGAKTLFATHYHELTDMEDEFDGIKNFNISVKKRGDEIIFLRRIVRGRADGSYGIEVAKLAGVPESVVKRAKAILKAIELNDETGRPVINSKKEQTEETMQISFTSNMGSEIIDKLKNVDVNTLTPIEALSFLYDIANEAQKL